MKKSPAPNAKADSEIPADVSRACLAKPMLARSRKATTYINRRKGSKWRLAREVARVSSSIGVGMPFARLMVGSLGKSCRAEWMNGAIRAVLQFTCCIWHRTRWLFLEEKATQHQRYPSTAIGELL